MTGADLAVFFLAVFFAFGLASQISAFFAHYKQHFLRL
jgi:hypothetical protein